MSLEQHRILMKTAKTVRDFARFPGVEGCQVRLQPRLNLCNAYVTSVKLTDADKP